MSSKMNKIIAIIFAIIANLSIALMIILFTIDGVTELGNIVRGASMMIGILAWMMAFLFWRKE